MNCHEKHICIVSTKFLLFFFNNFEVTPLAFVAIKPNYSIVKL